MQWESARDVSWEANYATAKQYYEEHGDLLASAKLPLGKWLSQLRVYKKSGIKCSYLTAERIDALNTIGMVWDVSDYLWEKNFHSALKYHRRHGELNVPVDYVDEEGIKLGDWLASLRSSRRNKTGRSQLSESQIARLNEIGMIWENKNNLAWARSYEAAREYYMEHGNLDIPVAYVAKNGCGLGKWIRHQREAYGKNLSEERKKKLDAIGMVWELEDPWESKFKLAQAYYSEHGNINMPADYVANGVWLDRWLSEQVLRLNSKRTKKLTEEQEKKLESLGVKKNTSRFDASWEKDYAEAKEFYLKNGHLAIPKGYISKSGKNLNLWVQRQRSNRKCGKMNESKIHKLDEIGMVWETPKTKRRTAI